MDQSKQLQNTSIFNRISHLEATIESHGLSSFDLLALCRIPEQEATNKLSHRLSISKSETRIILRELRDDLIQNDFSKRNLNGPSKKISTGLKALDVALSGGIELGEITEVFGPSGSGKSQFLLQVALQSQVQQFKLKESRGCIYISTEAAIETRRLSEMVESSMRIPQDALDHISYIYCQDGESQDHTFLTQLPTKLRMCREKNDQVRLILVDSIGHHYRLQRSFLNNLTYLRNYIEQQEAKLDVLPTYSYLKTKFVTESNVFFRGNSSFRDRNSKKFYLISLYRHLSRLAKAHDVAIVIANQVSDQFNERGDPQSEEHREDSDPLSLAQQVGSYSGWNREKLGLEKHMLDLREINSLTGNQGHFSKRRKLVDGNYDSNETSTARLEPPRKILALGFTWAKLVRSKILLWKSYRPSQIISRKSDKKENFQEMSGLNASSSWSSDEILSWDLRRFLKIVSPASRLSSETILFTLSREGLEES